MLYCTFQQQVFSKTFWQNAISEAQLILQKHFQFQEFPLPALLMDCWGLYTFTVVAELECSLYEDSFKPEKQEQRSSMKSTGIERIVGLGIFF